MQSLLLKLQADVAARKQPRSEVWPAVRGAVLGVALFASAFQIGAATAAPETGWAAEWHQRFMAGDAKLQSLEGQVDLQKMQIERLERIHQNSAKYGIGADLAAAIEEIALAEKIDPAVAFELVRVESEFNQRAVSPVGAIGFTQLMPETARGLAPGISRRQMFDRDTNLRLGFRFLRILIDQYRGDVHLALLAYNRGPGRVDGLLRAGMNPDNGYARKVLGGR